MLQLLVEEEIAEDHLQRYFEDLYRVVSVSERLPMYEQAGGVVRSTYVVDWEQLVHLLESYREFGEDIIEIARVTEDEARLWRQNAGSIGGLARA